MTNQQDPAQVFDLVLGGGRVIDPANGIDERLDVAIAGGRIALVAAHIPAHVAAQRIDVSEHIVTPGILDIHTHVYTFTPTDAAYVESVNADAHLVSCGVTTTVDAGTAGWRDFVDFKEKCIDKATTRILALINIASGGMLDRVTEQEIDELNPEITAAVASAYPEIIVGIKSAHYWTRRPWDAAHPPWASVTRAVQAGERCGKPVMVDFWPRPPERSYSELLLHRLRPGDIHTHVFAQQFPIVDAAGKVRDHLWQARKRGVILDLGHGAASFWFRNAWPALQDGFAPDSISTDLHMGNINGPVISMLNTMSKYLNMGMSLSQVIMRATASPARVIGRPDLGTLSVGAEADVAVFKRLEGLFGFADCGRARLTGRSKLECALTIRAGQIVYDPAGLSMPEWPDAPEAYWKVPELQG